MANELVITASSLAERGIDGATWSALKNSIYPGAKDESVMMALDYCRARNLDRSASEARSSGANEC